jgi:hypothetical protein
MINKKLEKLLEEAIAKKQELKESELGSAAVKPVHGSGEAKEHTPKLDNKDVYPADEHEQSEEVEEVIVETYTQEDLLELFEALELDTNKYTFEYLAEELGFEPLNEISKELRDSALKARFDKTNKAGEKFDSTPEEISYQKLLKKTNKKVPSEKLAKKLDISDKKAQSTPEAKDYSKGIDKYASASEMNRIRDKKEESEKINKEIMAESYTREDLEQLFEALDLDTDTYTFEYLAEELGFAPEDEVEMQQPAMVAVQPQPDQGEYDEEGSMAKLQIHTIADASAELYNMLDDNDNLPEWVQSKITLAKEYIDTARDYMKSQSVEQAKKIQLVPVGHPQQMHSQPELQMEEPLQERYMLKRPKGRPSNKSKAMDAKGSSEMNSKGEVIYTKSK